jgi:signal transduction histidine kinase
MLPRKDNESPMRRLPFQILIASLVLAGITLITTLLAVRALEGSAELTRTLGERQLGTLEQTNRLQELLFEKGFVATYIATRNRVWLDRLRERQQRTRAWLDEAIADSDPGAHRDLALKLKASYDDYSALRARTVALFESGDQALAMQALDDTTPAVEKVLATAQELAALSRRDLLETMERNDQRLDRAQAGLVLLSLAAALLGIAFGTWSGRRIARPIYELSLQAESADPDRVRLSTAAGTPPRDDLSTLSAHVTRLVQRLSEQRRRLVQAEKMEAIGEVTAKLAHEILNPVAGAKAALQVELRTRELPEQSRASLMEADRALSRIDVILARLMRYARPLEPHYRDVTADSIVEAGVAAIEHTLAKRQVTVERRISSDLPLVHVDPELMSQVVSNLVANAAQASATGARVQVTASRRDGAFVLEVDDRGHGLPPQRDKLFTPHFTTRDDGHGLGLAVCRNIVEEHAGSIVAAEGPDGVGARFIVTLPQKEMP